MSFLSRFTTSTDAVNPSATHLVLGTPLGGPWPEGTEVVSFGMGCFWGAEKKYWQVPGVVCTSVGYQGGRTESPTYKGVCGGFTGHAEVVQVAFNPGEVTLLDLLRVFWENHDPTQGDRQGNDIGTQYRSAVFCSTLAQKELAVRTRDSYAGALAARGFGGITTQIAMVDAAAAVNRFWLAEDYHQQYLVKNPNGYDCHSETGIALPSLG
ncbi:MAG: peptide-methionine (S)-S-oxide reductase MsrA [Actinomycetales bacterium]|nr:peptide-methionine (S)-S-oxide reductase MsrA [Actinomycetales bacterium]